MSKFMIGLALGLTVGVAGSAAAAEIVGRSGFLNGWTVTKRGKEVCFMPYIWISLREIECD